MPKWEMTKCLNVYMSKWVMSKWVMTKYINE